MSSVRLILLGLLVVPAAACGDGTAAVQSTPAPFDQVAAAKSGDMAAIREHAKCAGLLLGCPSREIDYDQKAACEDRVLVLTSNAPVGSLADADAYENDCDVALSGPDQQEAFAAAEQLLHTAYGRDAALPLNGVRSSIDHSTLAPAPDDLRARVNAELSKRALDILPPLANRGPAKVVYVGQVEWGACSAKVCFTAVAPRYGGGASAYRVTVVGHDAPADRDLAASLVTAALGQDTLAARVKALADGKRRHAIYVRAGTACWGMGEDAKGDALAGALAPPCQS